ncbi:MAG TPA: oligosaccharide flippase family protein [Chloroflexia bacterium]|nr:oligosaccharide flippase family protein [Chloroflexia bacterium]
MSILRRALGNTAIMLVAQLITWTATLITTAALGAWLGVADFGVLYLAMSISLLFAVLVEFGLNQQLVRAIARDPGVAGPYLVNALAIKLTLALVAYLIILGLNYWLGYDPKSGLVIAVYSLILAFNGIATTFTAVYQGMQRVAFAAIGTIVEKVLVSVLAILLLWLGFGVVTMAAVFVVGAAAGALWQGLWLRRVAHFEFRLDRAVIGTLVRNAIPFFAYWVLGSLYYRLDTILLSKMTGDEVLGWYGAAYRLFDTLVFLPSIISSAILFPILSQLSTQSRPALQRAMSKGLDTMLIVGVPICVGLFTLAGPIIGLIYRRAEFVEAVPALQWLAVGLLLLYVNSILAVTIISLNQEKKMTLVAGLALVLNLGLNLALIPRFQHVGAASTTAATEAFILVYLLVVMPRDLLSRSTLGVFAKAGVASAAMALVLTALQGQSLLLLIPLGAAVYAIVGIALRLVPVEDFRMIGAALGRRGRVAEAEETKA